MALFWVESLLPSLAATQSAIASVFFFIHACTHGMEGTISFERLTFRSSDQLEASNSTLEAMKSC